MNFISLEDYEILEHLTPTDTGLNFHIYVSYKFYDDSNVLLKIKLNENDECIIINKDFIIPNNYNSYELQIWLHNNKILLEFWENEIINQQYNKFENLYNKILKNVLI